MRDCTHEYADGLLSGEGHTVYWCPGCGAVSIEKNGPGPGTPNWQLPHSAPTRNERVTAFHRRFGHPVGTEVHVPSDDVMRFRMRIWWEEFWEALSAVFSDPDWTTEDRRIKCDLSVKDLIEWGKVKVNLPAFIDALEDVDYITEGHRVVMGVDGEPIAYGVHGANMQKAPNGLDKPIKPAGWEPVDIAALLRAQGWKP